jgi:hypothetical protein
MELQWTEAATIYNDTFKTLFMQNEDPGKDFQIGKIALPY